MGAILSARPVVFAVSAALILEQNTGKMWLDGRATSFVACAGGPTNLGTMAALRLELKPGGPRLGGECHN